MILRAVQFESIRVEVLPVDVDLQSALRILAGGVLEAVQLRPGQGQHQRGHITVEHWQLLHFITGQGIADVCSVRLQ